MAVLCLALVAAVLLQAGRADAHAGLVASNPSPGIGIPQPPGAVVLRFSEPLNRGLSTIAVLDMSDRDVGEGETLAVVGDERAMQRKVGLLGPGRYTVHWVSVSTLDGHRLRGSYAFGVGTSSTPDERVADDPVSSEGWVGLAGRYTALSGMTLWVGAALLAGTAGRAGLPQRRRRLLGRLGPSLVAVGTATSLAFLALDAGASSGALRALVLDGRSGSRRALIVCVAALSAALGPARRVPLVLFALSGVTLEAASGHAASAPLSPLAIGVASVHIIAVSVWLFAILASVLSTERLGVALGVFSPWAIAAAAGVGLTGAANAGFELKRPADLFSTGYGLGVVSKALVFTLMAMLGAAHNWMRRLHAVRPFPIEPPLRIPLKLELTAGALALAVAATLVGFPDPPRQVAEAERFAGVDPVLASIGKEDALSLAGASGSLVVGLTVIPPRAGPVDLRVNVLGVEPSDGLRGAVVSGSAPGGAQLAAELEDCGFGCFAGRDVLGAEGTWELRVSLDSNRGPVAVTLSAPIPAVDGERVLTRGLASYERLRAARMREALKGSAEGPGLVADYAFLAPNAFQMSVGSTERIVIGTRIFQREGASQPWTEGVWPEPGFSWPRDHLRQFWGGYAAARVVGSGQIDGFASTQVAFLRPDLPAWFLVWIGDADGRVRREEMLAEGHIMDHTYGDFDGPIVVEAPVG